MLKVKKHTFILIVCGGGGSRLWPKSTTQKPNQFINLFGPKNLFQETINRAKEIAPYERIFIIAGAQYVSDILKSDPQINPNNILIEPDKKHTAIAIAAGAAIISNIDQEAVIINLWSDSLIKNKKQFVCDVNRAAKAAFEKKSLVALGIKPTFPHTGLGYLETGKEITTNLFKVKRFLEKPNLEAAKKFVTAGNYYWNIGTYIWRTDVFLAELAKTSPDLHRQTMAIKNAWGKPNYWLTMQTIYQKVIPVAIDVAVSEKSSNMLLVPAGFDWQDVGDWQAVWENKNKDQQNNVLIGSKKSAWIDIDSRGCLVCTDNKLIATAGLKDLIVIDSPKALLICDKHQSQRVKEITEKLTKNN
ncbi:MAG: sugar phosphate nucleotidyltransferase [Candidatus Shapirobacteria bacterium]|nr:sugar phosphate nucleotidyltransferase [Candidatus Shapirobacteria bacterium]